METNVNYTIVGIFVISLLSAIILAILWLSSGLSVGRTQNYMVYMEESVSGLNIDSQVEFNGVNVGSVKSIWLNEKNPELVEVLLDIKSNTPITRGTVATLATRGLTGLAFLALKDRSTDLRPLLKKPDEKFPVIPTAPSIFMRLDKLLNRVAKNFEQITTTFQDVFDQENVRSIKQSLLNIEKVTSTLAINSSSLKDILINTKKATQQFTPLLQSGQGALRIFESQTLPSMARLLSNLDELVTTLSHVSLQLKQNPSVLIRGNPPPLPGPGERR